MNHILEVAHAMCFRNCWDVVLELGREDFGSWCSKSQKAKVMIQGRVYTSRRKVPQLEGKTNFSYTRTSFQNRLDSSRSSRPNMLNDSHSISWLMQFTGYRELAALKIRYRMWYMCWRWYIWQIFHDILSSSVSSTVNRHQDIAKLFVGLTLCSFPDYSQGI